MRRKGAKAAMVLQDDEGYFKGEMAPPCPDLMLQKWKRAYPLTVSRRYSW